MIIKTKAYARAGLIGNPSDGYFGKTISFIIPDFAAEATLFESPELVLEPAPRDQTVFPSMASLAHNVGFFGYYGGIRLLKATVKRFYDYCLEKHIQLDDRNFTIRYASNIPAQVGMAGSSAIITACLRALMSFYGVSIPKPVQANLILSVETRELHIPAGLQDRVIQVYEGIVYMNFDRDLMESQGYGEYVELDPSLLPPLYIAYSARMSEGTEVFHNDIRGRFDRGKKEVVEAMDFWAGLTDSVREKLESGEGADIGPLLNANFDRRREIYSKMNPDHLRMVETARTTGATAKFTGSGGAIVGTYKDEAMFEELVDTLAPLDVKVIKANVR